MKRFALMVLLLVAPYLSGRPADDVVDAARAAKEKRKKSTTRVITNADVKKAKGKIVEKPATSAPAIDDASATSTLAEQYESGYRDRIAADAKRAAAQKRVDDLEKQLAAIEQSYYEENDLDRRDKEIVKKFGSVKQQLETARGELSAPGE